ncbi:CAP domain-containing protein [Virgibacillus necropolis]|uniref:CAP domain-containing protein n=1 Tax=Virgibacillus necropolis TaxID=163877 RepID=UPI00384B0BE8
MFKKLGIVTTMSTALLLGGAFTNTVDAAETTDQKQNQTQLQQQAYKVFYSINAKNASNLNLDEIKEKALSNLDGNLNGLVQNILSNYQVNLKNDKQAEPEKNNEEKEQAKEQPTKKQEAPKQEEPKQEASKQEAPKQEEPKQEAPEQAESKQEAPAKAEAPAPQQPAKKQEQQAPAQSSQLNAYEQQVVELTNNERVERGLEPLKVDVELSKMARDKSRDMSVNNYFSHTSPTHGSPFDMMESYGIDYQSAGENIARGQRTPEEVVNGWMNSEGHRKNILSPKFTHIGVGYVADGNYWTQEFIGK